MAGYASIAPIVNPELVVVMNIYDPKVRQDTVEQQFVHPL